jgi:hypothetical protein
MTMNGKSVAQLKVLKKKDKQFAGAIHESCMRNYDATAAYNCYYIICIKYMIAATKFNMPQCKTIQSPVICATLNKMVINQNVSSAIFFGPKHFSGLALCNLHTLQGIQKI